MTQRLFREFISLFKDWPVDATKTGRCLGEHLRKRFSEAFNKGELSENINESQWQRYLNELRPIASNLYAAKYTRIRSTAALNISKDQCKLTMSNQAIKFINEKQI